MYSQSLYLRGKRLLLHEISNKSNPKKHGRNENVQKKKIFVGGIPAEATRQTLINFFQKYGEIEYCIVMTNKETNKPRGIIILI